MNFVLTHLAFALWVALDGLSRKIGRDTVFWAIGTSILLPLVLPLYLAKRPLKTGELRKGGTAWNVLKNFAILLTFLVAEALIMGVMAVEKQKSFLATDVERAAATMGMVQAIGVVAAVWFLLTAGTVVLGLLLKKDFVVETGSAHPG